MYKYEPKLGPRYWLLLATLTLSLLCFLSASASYDPRQTKRGLNSSSTAPANTVYVYTNGDVGVGLNPAQSEAAAKLHINGSIMIEDTTQGNGKVLTSDANGLASWVTPEASINSLVEDPSPILTNDLDVNGNYIFDSTDNGVDFSNDTVSTTGTMSATTFSGEYVTSPGGSDLLIDPSGTRSLIINEDGGNNDLRIESTGSTHMLFMDASQNRVGIGDSSPGATLEVAGPTIIDSTVTISSGSYVDSGNSISFGNSSLSTNGSISDVSNIALESISSANGTAINVDLDNGAGDDFTVNGKFLVVEGDTGKVGIGTAAPSESLQVNGNAIITGTLVVNAVDLNGTVLGGGDALFLHDGNTAGSNRVLGTNDLYDLSFETNGDTHMTLRANGDIGVGIAVPSTLFDINGNLAANEITVDTMTINGGSLVDTSGAIDFASTNLDTLGTVNGAVVRAGLMTLSTNVISSNGSISFSNENLRTNGDIYTHGVFIATGGNFTYAGGGPNTGEFLKTTDNLGNAVWGTALTQVQDDANPVLGGDLEIGAHAIVSTTGRIHFLNDNLVTTGYINGSNLNLTGTSNSTEVRTNSLYMNGGDLAEANIVYLNDIRSTANTTINVTTGNDPGDDFKVNGNTLVVEGDNSRVGIGTSSPAALFDVNGTALANLITIDTLTLNGGSITDSSGSIDFNDENLDTLGIISAGEFNGASFTGGSFTGDSVTATVINGTTINGVSIITDAIKFTDTPVAGYYLQSDANGNGSWAVALDELADDMDPDLSAALDANGYSIIDVNDISLDSITAAANGSSIAINLGTSANDDLLINGNTLVVEGDNSRVGIGTRTPGALLDINGTALANLITVDSLSLNGGTITDGSGTISFDDEDLITTGIIYGSQFNGGSFIGTTVTGTTINGLSLVINGTGAFEDVVTLSDNLEVLGNIDADGSINGASLTINGDTTLNGSVIIGTHGNVNYANGNGDLYVEGDFEVDGDIHLGDMHTDTLTVQSSLNMNGDINMRNGIDMSTYLIENIGHSGTDFTDNGGLTVRDDFAVNGSNFVVDVSAKSVGLGDADPESTLEIVRSGSTVPFMLSNGAAGDGDYVIVAANGDVGINDTTPAYLLDVNGTLGVNGVATLSDNLDVLGNLDVDGWINGSSLTIDGTINGLVFNGSTFNGGNFTGAAFNGSSFNGSTFTGGSFVGSTITGTTINGNVFNGSVFNGGDFTGAAFNGSSFNGSTFTGGSFVGSTITGTTINGDVFNGSVFNGGDFTGAAFNGSSFNGSTFTGGSFVGSTITGTTINGDVFNGSVFNGGDFTGAAFNGSSFNGSTFTGGSFVGSTITGTTINGNVFNGSVFNGGDFTGAAFNGSSFNGSTFTGGSFVGSTITGTTINGNVFNGSVFNGGDFTGATFNGESLVIDDSTILNGAVTIGRHGNVNYANGNGDLYVEGNFEVDGDIHLGDMHTDTLTVQSSLNMNGDINMRNGIDMSTYLIENIGHAGTDFTDNGGLTVRDDFTVNGADFVVDVSTASVGLGDLNPDSTLEIVRSGATVPFMLSNGAAGDGDYVIIAANGDVGINDTTPAYLLDINGTLGVNGVATLSDNLDVLGNLNVDGWINGSSLTIDSTINGLVFNGGTFNGGNFTGAAFNGSSFNGATFTGGSFVGSTITGTTINGNVFNGAVFNGGDFTGAAFNGSSFNGSTFTGGSFVGSTITGTTINGDVFNGAVFNGGDFTGDTFNGSSFNGATFTGGIFNGSEFNGTTITGQTINGASFNGTTFNGTTFNGDLFNGATFTGGIFNGSEFNGTTITGQTINGSSFNGTTFNGTTFNGDLFNGATFTGGIFNGSEFNGTTITGQTINGATFNGTTFNGTTFNGNLFNGATFTGGIFNGSEFNGTTITGQTINGATFNGGDFFGDSFNGRNFYINGAYALTTSAGASNGQFLMYDNNGETVWATVTGGGGSGDYTSNGDTAGADRLLGNRDDYALSLITNNLEALTIDNNGYVGIGDITPDAYFEVNGAMLVNGDITSDATINGASFNGTTFNGTTFNGDLFNGDLFNGATFTGGIFNGSEFNGTTITGQTINGASFNGTTFNGTTFNGDLFNGATFTGGIFNGSEFNGTTITGQTINGASFNGTTFNGTTFNGDLFNGATFTGGIFNGSEFNGTTITGQTINGASFNGTTFNGTTFNGDLFNGATFTGGIFNGSEFNGTTITAETVNGASFNGTTFNGTTFNGDLFNGATFTGGIFNGSEFNGTTITGQTINGATFNGGDFFGDSFNGRNFYINGAYALTTSAGASNGQFLMYDNNGETVWATVTGGGGSGDYTSNGDTAGADRLLGNRDDYALSIITNNLEALTIDNNGYVGIGDITPDAFFEVNGAMLVNGDITSDATINGSSFNGTTFNGTTFNGDLFNGATFTGGIFNGSEFNGTTITGQTINGASFNGTTFNGTTFNGDLFNGATFTGGIFNGSEFNGTTITGQTINGASFNGTTFNGTTFNGDLFNGATFTGGIFNGSEFNGTTITGQTINGASFNGTTFNGTTFNGDLFNGATFTGGIFNGSEFNGTTITGQTINGATFNGGDFFGDSFNGRNFYVNGAYALTTSAGTNGQFLMYDNNGETIWATTSGVGDYTNNGDTAGADRLLGNLDDQGLTLIINGSSIISLNDNGYVGFGDETPDEFLDINGSILVNGNITSDATINGGVFNGSTFNGTTFNGSVFNGSTFNGGNFTGATFNGSLFNGSSFNGGTFTGSTITGTTINGSVFNGSTFNGGNFTGATFNGSLFNGSSFNGGTFTGSTITGTTINGSVFNGSTFNGGNFTGATFNGSLFNGSSFNGGTFTGSTITGTTINGSVFNGSTFNGGNFTGATFNGSLFNGSSFNGVTFNVNGAYALTTSAGTNGQYLMYDNNGETIWAAAAATSGGDYTNNGDEAGADRLLGNLDDQGLTLIINGSHIISLDDNGYVGFGDDSPDAFLDVNGAMLVNGNINSTATITGTTLVAGSLTMTSGYITDGGSEINFGDEDLITNGDITAAAANLSSLDLDNGNITNVNDIALHSISSADNTTVNVNIDNGNGDDFTVNASYLVVEGDTGFVGIGLTEPTVMLDVNGSGLYGGELTVNGNVLIGNNSASGILDMRDGDSNFIFNGATASTTYSTNFVMDDSSLSIGHNHANRRFDLKTASAARISIAGNGDVGIGTINPAAVLDVSGDLNVDSTTTLGDSLDVAGVTTLDDDLIVDTDDLYVDTTASRVGIGDDTPSNTLTVDGAASISSYLQVGQEEATTFSRFGNANNGHVLSGAEDVLISGDLEIDGTTYVDGPFTTTSSGSFASIDVGGGYNDTGVTLSSAGNIQADGNLTIDGTSHLVGVVTTNGDIEVGGGGGSGSGVTIGTAGTIEADAAVDFNSTLDVTGNVTIGGGYNVSDGVTISTTGNIQADGNLTIDGTSLLSGNTTASGTLTVTGDLTVDTSVLKVDTSTDKVGIGDTSPSNKLTVTGAASITSYLQVGQETATTYSRFGSATTDNSLSGASDVLISGKLEVVGATYFNGDMATNSSGTFDSIIVGGGNGSTGVTLSSNGNVLANGRLEADGATTLGSTLAISGVTTIGGGNGSTGTTITAAGNILTDGTVDIDGATTINNTLAVNGNTSIGDGFAGNGITLAGNGDTQINGTLAVNEVTTLSDNLDVLGETRFGGGYLDSGITISSAGAISADGAAILASTLAVGGVLQVGGLSAGTYSKFGTDPTNGHGLNASDDLLISDVLEVHNATYLDSTLDVVSATTFGGGFADNGVSIAQSGNTQINGTLAVADASTLSGATSLGSTLAVTGISTFNDVTIMNSRLDMNGTENISLGANYISYDDSDQGISLSTNGDVVLSANLTTATGTLNGANLILSSGFKFTATPGVDKILASDAGGNGSWISSASLNLMSNLADDTNPELGGNLNTNGFNLYSVNGGSLKINNGNVLITANADNGVIINENGDDSDFRVEGDNETHLIFTDAANDRVGIKRSTPSTELDVNGTVTATGLFVNGTSATNGDLTIVGNTTANGILAIPSPAATVSLANGDTLTATRSLMRIKGDSGEDNLTSNPQIDTVSAVDGQILVLKGESNVDTITFDDGDGLSLEGGVSFTLGEKCTLMLIYDAVDDVWIEISRASKSQ